jgi:hypothetical protein
MSGYDQEKVFGQLKEPVEVLSGKKTDWEYCDDTPVCPKSRYFRK